MQETDPRCRTAVPDSAVSRWLSCRHWRGLLAALLLLNLQPAFAAVVTVRVLDAGGKPVSSVVVTLVDARHATPGSEPRNASMTMDQMNMRFVPEVLVVPVGASVAFPNSDTVSHQVYSFSPAKTFQISLYKGSANPPVLFDKPGLVVLGCNIHDAMVGYIYVTDAPLFGLTDKRGQISWDAVNSGSITVTIWSPMLADEADSLVRTLHLDATTAQQSVEFRLRKPIRSSPSPRPRHTEWDY